MTLAQLEKRVERLEEMVQNLNPVRRSGKWYIENAGRFKDDPIYEEIVRRGREYRESLRPKPSKSKKRP
jgi:hypothetical protein